MERMTGFIFMDMPLRPGIYRRGNVAYKQKGVSSVQPVGLQRPVSSIKSTLRLYGVTLSPCSTRDAVISWRDMNGDKVETKL